MVGHAPKLLDRSGGVGGDVTEARHGRRAYQREGKALVWPEANAAK